MLKTRDFIEVMLKDYWVILCLHLLAYLSFNMNLLGQIILDGSFVLIPHWGHLISSHSWIVRIRLNEVILLTVSDVGAFPFLHVEVTIFHVGVWFVSWPLCTLESWGFGKLGIASDIEEGHLYFVILGAECLHPWDGLERRKDDLVLLQNCKSRHRIDLLTLGSFFLPLLNPVLDLTSLQL